MTRKPGQAPEKRDGEPLLSRWSRLKKEALIRGDFDHLRKLSQSRDQSIGDEPGISTNR